MGKLGRRVQTERRGRFGYQGHKKVELCPRSKMEMAAYLTREREVEGGITLKIWVAAR